MNFRSRDLRSRVFSAFRASNRSWRRRLTPDPGMLRLRRVGCVRNVAACRTRIATARSHSTHNHGHDDGRPHSHLHPHEHHPARPELGSSTGPTPTFPPLDPTVSSSASEACRKLVLKRDYESFLTSKFYPKSAQDGFFALKAFYVYTVPLSFCLQN